MFWTGIFKILHKQHDSKIFEIKMVRALLRYGSHLLTPSMLIMFSEGSTVWEYMISDLE